MIRRYNDRQKIYILQTPIIFVKIFKLEDGSQSTLDMFNTYPNGNDEDNIYKSSGANWHIDLIKIVTAIINLIREVIDTIF